MEKKGKERLDQFLAKKMDVSRSKIQKLISEGKVLVDGKTVSASFLVDYENDIEVNDELNYEITVEKENIPLDIVYEDDYLLIVNKKSGMVVHPAAGNYSGTLVNALLYRFDLKGGSEKYRPGIVHRIDKDTSGLMVVAKDEKTHELLSEMIKNKEVERKYIAIVEGVIPHETGTIDAPIGRDINNRQKMAVTSVNGKDSITHFRVLERFSKYTLIECTLETGRTHQIRVHAASIGHPLLGDPIYGPKNSKIKCKGQTLHARKLGFIHPTTKQYVEFNSDLPDYFVEILNKIK